LSKVVGKEEIMKQFTDGKTVMIAGFAGTGEPKELTDMLLESGAKNLTIISNDTGYSGDGVGRLFESGQGVKLVCSYIGMDPNALAMIDQKVTSGELELDLNPQGTLCERIRSGGAGLGGVLTPTGIGTVVEKGKQKIEVDGKEYLLETALHADIALIKAWKADTVGNLIYRGTSRTYNPIMATAADTVIVIVDEVVPTGTLDPEVVVTPGVFVSMIYKK
jgi:acetate CoA/acetoacetate CoA-transferase alpha subunit